MYILGLYTIQYTIKYNVYIYFTALVNEIHRSIMNFPISQWEKKDFHSYSPDVNFHLLYLLRVYNIHIKLKNVQSVSSFRTQTQIHICS